jgi:ribonuclease Z
LKIIAPRKLWFFLQEYSQCDDLDLDATVRFQDARELLTEPASPKSAELVALVEKKLYNHGHFGSSKADAVKLAEDESSKVEDAFQMASCLVDHCYQAYGFSVSHPGNNAMQPWKVVYSGDTRPCDRLVALGMNASMLIHEATFDDELKSEAIARRHSTISEAVEVGTKMKAKQVILTHFSQRYPKLPSVKDTIVDTPPNEHSPAAKFKQDVATEVPVAFAFDFMTVSPSGMKRYPSLMPALQEVFTDLMTSDNNDSDEMKDICQ